jgi:hypothetical protein
LLSDNRNNITKNTTGVIGGYLGQRANLGIRSNTVVNGISSLKTNNKFIWTLILLVISGNWLSHHLAFCTILLCVFFILKSSRIILKNLKICKPLIPLPKTIFACQ